MPRRAWIGLAVALIAACILAIAIGSVRLTPGQVFDALRGVGDAVPIAIVRTLRLPRVLIGVLVGAGLGLSGGALQGAMRNPLAEPYLLGVSGGAAVGAVIAGQLGVPSSLIGVAAFLGAMLAVVAAFSVAQAARAGGDARVLLMAGVVVGAFANAAIMIVLANADPNSTRSAVWWMMGSTTDAGWPQIVTLAVYIFVGGGALVVFAREIDVLALGEDAAAGLGLDVTRALRRVFLLASLIAASTVAAAGLIGFVGLVVPHIVRGLGARRHRPLLIGCAMAGGTLVVCADLVGRVVRPPAELPVGAITALVGVPFFLTRLRRLV